MEQGGAVEAARAQADVVVVNTCAVTEQAERSARALIRRVRRENPGARVVVTGCYAQRAPAELRGLGGVDVVVGNSHKGLVAETALGEAVRSGGGQGAGFVPLSSLGATLHAPFPGWGIGNGRVEAVELGAPAWRGSGAGSGSGRTRPTLKVQDGCGNRCSFCVIPETRGPSRSVGLEAAVEAARAFAESGGQELVLSGINLGRWGRDLRPAGTLAGLVRAILEGTELPRLRVSSVEPMDWDGELLAAFAEYGRGQGHARLAPHAHLPLQSGADAVLRRMHRRYRPWHYAEKVEALRALLPDAAIGADVMVGFPGETEALFRESFEFIEALPLTYLHLFPFSARPGTAAEAWHREAPVAAEAVRERMRALEALDARKREAFARRFVGRRVSAVTLRDGTALTDNFLPVDLGAPETANRLRSVWIASIRQGRLQALKQGRLQGLVEGSPDAESAVEGALRPFPLA